MPQTMLTTRDCRLTLCVENKNAPQLTQEKMTKVTPDLMPKPTHEPTPRTKVMPDRMPNRTPKPTPKQLKPMPPLVHNYHRHEEDIR